MTNPTSMIDVFNMFLEHSRDPFLNSMQGLPANVLDRLMADMVKNAEVNCQDGRLSIIVDMKAFKNRVKAAFTSEIVEDEVGVLIQFGASKNVISELTGVHQTKIVSKRKIMDSDIPGQGRPTQLDAGDRQFIIDAWRRFRGNRVVRLVRTHHYSRVPINDVWMVVRDLSKSNHAMENSHVSEQDSSYAAQ